MSNHYFLNVQNSSFDDNTAYKEGGAIYLRPSALADLRFSNFSNNQAVSRYGGAIFADSGSIMRIYDSVVNNNVAFYSGGGV